MNASQISHTVKNLIEQRLPAFVWGAPGIGKSSIVKQIAKEYSYEFVDLRLSLLDATDLKGIPFFDPKSKKGVWAPPSFLPDDPGSKGILFLDEINSAPPMVQASAYQLILDRRVGEYELPEKWSIVAAGNRENDRGIIYKMPSPLANRFVHLHMSVEFNEWKKWAYESDIDELIISFLSYDNSMLFNFDSQKKQKAFATPRSWEFASTIVRSKIDKKLIFETLSGTVGEDASVEFISFLKVMDRLPDIDAILEGKLESFEDDDHRVLMALCIGITNRLRQRRSAKSIQSVVKFSLSLEPEFSILLIKEMQQHGIRLEGVPSWKSWVKKFAYLLE